MPKGSLRMLIPVFSQLCGVLSLRRGLRACLGVGDSHVKAFSGFVPCLQLEPPYPVSFFLAEVCDDEGITWNKGFHCSKT